MSNNVLNLTVLFTYMALLMGVGIYQGRKAKTTTDFNMGGRNIPGWAAALSERATGESAWCLVGFPGFAFAAGVVSIWVAVGLFLGNVVAWTVLANKMRKEAEKYDAQTYVDWVAKRHAKSKSATAVKLFGSFIVIFLFAFYVEAQLIGGGKTLQALFGLPQVIGILVTMAVIIPYTVWGGFQSVVYTDCVQSVIMILTLVGAPLYGLYYISVTPGMYATSVVEALHLAGPTFMDWTGGAKGIFAGFMIASNLAWFIAYLGGCPHLTVRFMSMRDEGAWKLGRNIAVVWTFFGYAGAIGIGLIGLAIFGPGGIPDAEMVMPLVVLKIFPPVLAAICVTGAIAAMLSTADSMLIVTSSEFTENILRPVILKGKAMDPKKELLISRMVTVAVGLSALVLAFVIPANMVYTIVSFAWGCMGNPFAVVTCATLFWDKFTGTAALWTMICGFFGTILWQVSPLNAIIDARLAGVFPALLAAYFVTKMTYGKDECECEEAVAK
ncbi:MAG: sodium/proline symporter [Synergistaceae bacterium]|nr:sodium/proline symporter [Synergistaceae bacterium]